jgi:hypothetical protein
VARGVDDLELGASHGQDLAVREVFVRRAVRVGQVPHHAVLRVQEDRRAGELGQLRGGVDVVVVAVGAHDRLELPLADSGRDGFGVVRRVDHDDLGVVADQPHVVVDFPATAVELEHAGGDHVLHYRRHGWDPTASPPRRPSGGRGMYAPL